MNAEGIATMLASPRSDGAGNEPQSEGGDLCADLTKLVTRYNDQLPQLFQMTMPDECRRPMHLRPVWRICRGLTALPAVFPPSCAALLFGGIVKISAFESGGDTHKVATKSVRVTSRTTVKELQVGGAVHRGGGWRLGRRRCFGAARGVGLALIPGVFRGSQLDAPGG